MTFTPDWLSWPETQTLVAAFGKEAGALRFVGGAVRDALLGRSVVDVDAATRFTPEAVMALLERAGIGVIPTGLAHGTVTAVVAGRHFEITTLRKDVEADGRHAQVAFTDDWKEDAQRRDFTMNALYLSPEGELFDYFGGVADAQAGRVRFIGEASQRIAEDYLRILRFFRFHAHYGKGAPEDAAVAACAKAAPDMARLSGERVQAEMLKLLASPMAGETLLLMQRHGIVQAALPVVSDVAVFTRIGQVEAVSRSLAAEWKLAGFIWPKAAALAPLAARLRLSGRVEKGLSQLLSHAGAVHARMPEYEQKALIRRLGAPLFAALAQLCWAAGGDAIVKDSPYMAMLALADSWQAPVFPVTGEDLKQRGMEEGKALGEALKRLEAAWEASDYCLGRDALLAQL